MEAGADFQEGTNSAVQESAADGRFSDSREHLQKGGFSGPVPTDHSDNVAFVNLKRHVTERPDPLARITWPATGEVERRAKRSPECFRETAVRILLLADLVALAEAFHRDRDVTHLR